MKLEPNDIPNVILDLLFFCEDYPNCKIPMRYINILARVLSNMLTNHPAVVNDVLSVPIFVAPPKADTMFANWKPKKEKQ